MTRGSPWLGLKVKHFQRIRFLPGSLLLEENYEPLQVGVSQQIGKLRTQISRKSVLGTEISLCQCLTQLAFLASPAGQEFKKQPVYGKLGDKIKCL